MSRYVTLAIPGQTTTLKVSNKEMEDNKNQTGSLIKGISETIGNETKQQKGRLLGMLLGTLQASLLRNMLAGKGVKVMRKGQKAANRKGKGIITVGEGRETIRARCHI